MLIGNLTRDPELRYTPQGTAVCTFGLATNRSWSTEAGEKREETEFHRIVAWNKLAELCSQLLFKGRRIYVEGRLQTRTWTDQSGNQRQATEVVIEEMIILDSRQGEPAALSADEGGKATAPVKEEVAPQEVPEEVPVEPTEEEVPVEEPLVEEAKSEEQTQAQEEKAGEPAGKGTSDDVSGDIPF